MCVGTINPVALTQWESDTELAQEVVTELSRARTMFPAMHSPHEALAVLEEEVDELRQNVYAHNMVKSRDMRPQMREEAIQVAAMALRMIKDVL